MCQINDTLMHKGVPNVALKQLLKTTDKKNLRNVCKNCLEQKEIIGPINFLHRQ